MVRQIGSQDPNLTVAPGAAPAITGNTVKKKRIDVPGDKDVGIRRTLVPLEPEPVGPSVKALFPKAVTFADVGNANDAAEILSQQLGQPGLRQAILEAVAATPPVDQPAMLKTLAAYAVLVDQATTMMDYSKLRHVMGWFSLTGVRFNPQFPVTRRGYQERRYLKKHEETSAPRQGESRANLGAALHAALGAKAPKAALESTLVTQFYAELGLPEAATAGWAGTAAGVEKAMAHEALIPLRALYDATAALDHDGVGGVLRRDEPALNEACRQATLRIIQHVAQGDFEDWRIDSSKEQLRSLGPDQLGAYRTKLVMDHDGGRAGKLTTYDEQGLDLMWVTKIAGPSHGFDLISQCLLPLLGNGRNGAIVVDQEGWPRAARSTVRMLEDTDGRAMLYVEMNQVCFEHPRGDETAVREQMRTAILRHALAKAQAMGVRLVVAPSRDNPEKLLRPFGVEGKREDLQIRLTPSNMVFESSDTLTNAHHAPQTEERVVKIPNAKARLEHPLEPRPFVVEP